MATSDADLEFRVRILRAARLFRDAAPDDLIELARVARVTAIARGKNAVRPGNEGSSIYVMQSGVAAELHLELGEDRPILVGLIGASSVAGVVSALLRESAPAKAEDTPAPRRRIEALSNVSLLSVPTPDFLRIVRRSPELSAALAVHLAERCDDLASIFAKSTDYTLEMRLATFFSRVATLSALDDWNPVINLGRLSQSSIATMLGVSRENVNRTLAIWERSGLIFQAKNGDVLVQNAKRLAHLATAREESRALEKAEDWLWEIDTYLDRGINQAGLHIALEATKRAPKDPRYLHRVVLATARLGAVSEALALFEKGKLGRYLEDEELACLYPRLLRDLAFSHGGEEPDQEPLGESAREYEKIFERTGGFYSGVNAAAGYMLIKEPKRAKKIAARVYDKLTENSSDEISEQYWWRSTLAECKLLIGDAPAAASLFEAATSAYDATPGKRASTRKQLRRLSQGAGIDEAWIDRAVAQPAVIYFSGPIARAGEEESEAPQARLKAAITEFLEKTPIGWAFGALASGADIIIAEAVLEAGAELHVHLPIAPADFLKSSVHIGGPSWRERYIACMKAASSVEWARRTRLAGNAAYRLGALVAMGKAVRLADQLETKAIGYFATQKDGEATSLSIANTRNWKARGLEAIEIADDWPTKAISANAPATGEEELLFGVVLQAKDETAPPKSLVNACDICLKDEMSGLDLFLFESLENALSAAAEFAGSKHSASFCAWLDAGAFDRATVETSTADTVSRLVTAACRPLTEPGKVFASDAFACAAALVPSCTAAFEYVGYMPTREKLDPCALSLVRF